MYANKEIEELKKDIRMREREIVGIKNRIYDISKKNLEEIPVKYYMTDLEAIKILGRDKDGYVLYRNFYFESGTDISFGTFENFKSLSEADEWVVTLGRELTRENFIECLANKFKEKIEKY